MGQDETHVGPSDPTSQTGAAREPADAPVLVSATGDTPMRARRGEVIGLAGLAGHGQTDLLLRLQAAGARRSGRAESVHVGAATAFVAGDRQTDGVFGLWSIQRNMSVGWLNALQRGRGLGLIDLKQEAAMAQGWRQRLGLVTPDLALPIHSLSGGNQQKALFARALGGAAPIILMDDPMRGVDVGTKRDVYGLIAAEAAAGRTFIWYTTEFEELYHCDRICVFNNGRIVGELTLAELTEERVLSLSFDEVTA